MKTYRFSRKARILLTLAALPLIALFAGTPWLILKDSKSGMDAAAMIIIAVFGGMALFFLYAAVTIHVWKFEVTEDRIRECGLFRTKEIPLDSLAGYHIQVNSPVNAVRFEPKGKGLSAIRFEMMISDRDEFLAWLQSGVPNLDSTETEAETREILANRNYGTSEREREKFLLHWNRWASFMNMCTVGIVLWAMFYPRPYEILIWALAVIPFIGLVSMHLSRGIIRIDTRRDGVYPDITLSVMMPPMGLGLRALVDFSLLAWKPLAWPAALIAAVMILLTIRLSTELKKRIVTFMIVLVFLSIHAFSASLVMNCMLDTSPPKEYRATVIDRHESSGRHTTYYLKLGPWGPRSDADDVDVGKEVYQKYKPGDMAAVTVRQGRFGASWYYVQ